MICAIIYKCYINKENYQMKKIIAMIIKKQYICILKSEYGG